MFSTKKFQLCVSHLSVYVCELHTQWHYIQRERAQVENRENANYPFLHEIIALTKIVALYCVFTNAQNFLYKNFQFTSPEKKVIQQNKNVFFKIIVSFQLDFGCEYYFIFFINYPN